jgi:hypothetical protein
MPGHEIIEERAALMTPTEIALIEALGTGGYAKRVPRWMWDQDYVRRAVRIEDRDTAVPVFELHFRGEELMRAICKMERLAARASQPPEPTP